MLALRRADWKTMLIGVLILVVGILVAYFAGRGLERGSAQKELAVASSNLTSANQRNATLQSRVELLTANVWVYRASTALDNRNFGVANEAMANAVARLNQVDADAARLDPGALASLQKDAAALKIVVATDLEPQRAQLLKLAASVTALASSAN